MENIIVIMSTQYPGHGGAATNSYAIIKYLRMNGYKNTVGIFFDDKTDINVDPDNIGQIYHLALEPFTNKRNNKIKEYQAFLNYAIGNPSLILCKNYIAPICSKILYPDTKNIYFISGLCNAISICNIISANQIYTKNLKIPRSKNDTNALNSSDLVVINSPLTKKIFCNSYHSYLNKVYPDVIDTTKYAPYLLDTTYIDTSKKIYDFIVVSSILTRKEKNNQFLIKLFKNPIFNKYSKLIIGDKNEQFRNIPNSVVYNFMPHRNLMQFMQKAKILLYPSLYDSNPNTIREAIYNKCIVLISKNIGYYNLFPDISVCETYHLMEWTNKSVYLLENYDNLIKNYLVEFNSTDDHLLTLINNNLQ